MSTSSDESLIQMAHELAMCEKENEVIQVLTKHGLWTDDSLWRDYGDIENNFSSIGNQMESADAALTEKIINSCDSLLMSACVQEGIDPVSPLAPRTIKKALQRFFNIREGVISYLSESERSKLAENIGLVATGGKTKPSFAIFDKGTGQSPSQFPGTFMSLNASNKIRIPFVQGKFNMGSTGALPFCGDRNLQLIISKKNPAIANEIKDGGFWGLTIVRRDPPVGQMKTSVFKYLAPENNEVLRFKAEGLRIIPENGGYPNAYQEELEYGTFIKLYEYDIGPGLRTNILLDLYNRLNLLLPRLFLPVRLYERRGGYDAHSYETTLSGLTTRVELDRNENLEPNFPSSSSIAVDGVNLKLDIYAFKKRDKGSAKEKYAKSEGVVFTLNGQAHGFLSKDFFSRRQTGMDYLKNSILVHVDCSNIDGIMRENLFMNSRDRLRNGQLKKLIESKLENVLSKHEGLKELREKRKREILADQISDDKPLAEILEALLKGSKSLSAFLIDGKRISNPFKTKHHKRKNTYEGKKFPTYYEPVYPHPSNNPRMAELGRAVRLQFKTDAENQYFTRETEPGYFKVHCIGHKELSWDDNLWNGKHNITIDLPKSTKLGQQIMIQVTVNDDSRPEPFMHDVYLNVVPKKHRPPSPPNPNPVPPGPDPGPDVPDQGVSGIPNVHSVAKDQWEEHGFDKFSGLRVAHNGEGYDYFYNRDNAYLLQEQKISKDTEAELLESQFSTALVIIGMGIMSGETNVEEEKRARQVESITKLLSPLILPIINGLGAIKLNDI